MANHHLRNRELSLKAKGLLSLMLSLPEDWDYTTKGLSCICKDGVDSICATIKELEKAGYVKRRRLRDAQGRLPVHVRCLIDEAANIGQIPSGIDEVILQFIHFRDTMLENQGWGKCKGLVFEKTGIYDGEKKWRM